MGRCYARRSEIPLTHSSTAIARQCAEIVANKTLGSARLPRSGSLVTQEQELSDTIFQATAGIESTQKVQNAHTEFAFFRLQTPERVLW